MYTSVQKITPPPPPFHLKIVTIFHSITFYSILDQINAALVNRNVFQKYKKYLTLPKRVYV